MRRRGHQPHWQLLARGYHGASIRRPFDSVGCCCLVAIVARPTDSVSVERGASVERGVSVERGADAVLRLASDPALSQRLLGVLPWGETAPRTRGAGIDYRGAVSRPSPSWNRSLLTVIYLCHAC
eukprot:COSAG06_NODE_35924_length_454_cov_0.450704_1_plen_124_part_01